MVERWRLSLKSKGAGRPANTRVAAAESGYQTAFLSHSHIDRHLALGLQAMLLESGWRVYLDWQDEAMPKKPNAETAARIVTKIEESRWFLMLATPNSLRSLWCPWEVGIADQVKGREQVFIVVTSDIEGELAGTAYYELYKRIAAPEGSGALMYAYPGERGGMNLEYLNCT